jgi:hypothetical protein
MAALLGALQYFANAHNINKKDILPSRRGLVVSVYSVHQERTLTRENFMKQKQVIVIVGLCMASVLAAFAGRSSVEARMKTIIFEDLDIRSISFVDAVEFLRQEARSRDPIKKGINIILKRGSGPNPTLSLMMGKTTLYKVLRLITETAEYQWRYIGDTLILEPIPPSTSAAK